MKSIMLFIAAFSENRTESQETQQPDIAAANVSQKCSYCGNKKHSRRSCPARYVECYRCSKRDILLKSVIQWLCLATTTN